MLRHEGTLQGKQITVFNLAAERAVVGGIIEDESLLPEVLQTGIKVIDLLLVGLHLT